METESKLSLVESFSRYFSVKVAESDADKQDVFKIRYRVYCEEFRYEDVGFFPDGLERDEYDDISRHCLVTHRETGLPAGCVRVVPAMGPSDVSPLPFEKHCVGTLDQALIDSMQLDRRSVGEISRLAVDGRFRRRGGETITRFGEIHSVHLSAQEQRACSLITMSCFLATAILGELENKTKGFAMMEPFLPRLVTKSGIEFVKVGKDVNYHGIRAPYFISYDSALENMHPDLNDLFQWLRESMAG